MFRLIGGFLTLTPDFCFVVEDDVGLVGYALAALDAKQFHKKMELSWLPEMCQKYPQPEKTSGETLSNTEVHKAPFVDTWCGRCQYALYSYL
jgi:protein O-GlcNAcase/histone acetyltransferase